MMRYHVLATDYDGTLAHHGQVEDVVLIKLKEFLETGRRLMLVTGRELSELREVFPHLDLFEWVVAENGALLYHPASGEEKPLAEPPSPVFIERLKARKVSPLSIGRVIVATVEPHEKVVLETIRDLGLELQVIFNKGAVMVLPSGINKATGMAAALKEMHLSHHNVVAVGDAENDHAFLSRAELSVAVANALPALKETADFVADVPHGNGVMQLIDHLVTNDFVDLDAKLQRHYLTIGTRHEQSIALPPYGPRVLICGGTEHDRSAAVMAHFQLLLDKKYQFCVFDSQGHFSGIDGAVVLGGSVSPLPGEEPLKLLEKTRTNAVVCFSDVDVAGRREQFQKLMGEVFQLREQIARPHWIVIDDAEELIGGEWTGPFANDEDELRSIVFVAARPESLSPKLLEQIDTVIGVGGNSVEMLSQFAQMTSRDLTAVDDVVHFDSNEAFIWQVNTERPPIRFQMNAAGLARDPTVVC